MAFTTFILTILSVVSGMFFYDYLKDGIEYFSDNYSKSLCTRVADKVVKRLLEMEKLNKKEDL